MSAKQKRIVGITILCIAGLIIVSQHDAHATGTVAKGEALGDVVILVLLWLGLRRWWKKPAVEVPPVMQEAAAPPVCPCQNCNQRLEFNAQDAGQKVTCPNCQMETTLFIPFKPTASTGIQPTIRTAWKKPVLIFVAILFGLWMIGIGIWSSTAPTPHNPVIDTRSSTAPVATPPVLRQPQQPEVQPTAANAQEEARKDQLFRWVNDELVPIKSGYRINGQIAQVLPDGILLHPALYPGNPPDSRLIFISCPVDGLFDGSLWQGWAYGAWTYQYVTVNGATATVQWFKTGRSYLTKSDAVLTQNETSFYSAKLFY